MIKVVSYRKLVSELTEVRLAKKNGKIRTTGTPLSEFH